MDAQDKPLSYRPSAFYFRKALDEVKTLKEAREVGHQAIRELEMLKAWVRDQGMIPPRQFITLQEAEDKALVEAIPFSPAEPEPTKRPRKRPRR